MSIKSVSQPEGNGTPSTTPMNFTITLTGTITSAIKVNYATATVGSADGNDFQSTSGQITFFPNGATTATVTVKIYGDKSKEPDEIFDVVLTIPSGQTGYTLGTLLGIGTIKNDD